MGQGKTRNSSTRQGRGTRHALRRLIPAAAAIALIPSCAPDVVHIEGLPASLATKVARDLQAKGVKGAAVRGELKGGARLPRVHVELDTDGDGRADRALELRFVIVGDGGRWQVARERPLGRTGAASQ